MGGTARKWMWVVVLSMAGAMADDSSQTTLPLLPERLGPMESVLWGRSGALRIAFDFPLTVEAREKEMRWRRNMLGLHQFGGFVTLASMIATVVVGQKVYNGATDLSQIHKALAWNTIGLYSTTAVLAVFTPPPLIRRSEWSTVSTHKFLASLHLTGMALTPYLGRRVYDGERDLAKFHLASGYATTVVFGTALLAVTF